MGQYRKLQRSLLLLGLVLELAQRSILGAPPPSSSQPPAYKYLRVGNDSDVSAVPRSGFALMGGGKDLDEAFRWLCVRAGGGDFLIIRAAGAGDYNRYVQSLCRLNSVATVVIPNREAALDPFVEQTIRRASAIFIAGGDQANYINFWMGTPVQTAMNDAIRRGVPIGGTSAGLAVMGEYIYTAQGDKPDDPNLDGRTALADPFSARVTLARGFLDIPILKNIITDTHFARRDRMGRLLVFLARLNEPDGKPAPKPLAIRGIGVQERAAVLLEPDGRATVVGNGDAYFIDAVQPGGPLEEGKPLTFPSFRVEKVAPGDTYDVKAWAGDAIAYTLSVEAGKVKSTQTGGEIY
jgi:cyanophycinase